MNIVEAIRIVLKDAYDIGKIQFPPAERHITVIAAQSEMMTVLNGHNALAPNWSKAPEGASHYCINPNGRAFWSWGEPVAVGDHWLHRNVLATEPHKDVDIPLGIDWRLCKWQRPQEAAA